MANGSFGNLDTEFGECVEPNRPGIRVRQFEAQCSQLSRMVLSRDSAEILKRYLRRADAEPILLRWPALEFTIIWVAGRGGEIIFAIEEAVRAGPERGGRYPAEAYDPEGQFWRYPLAQSIGRMPQHNEAKLGHPALVLAAPARIGGEIVLDKGEWWLLNNSGRYGLNLGRTEAQLVNVAKRFAEFGIHLKWMSM